MGETGVEIPNQGSHEQKLGQDSPSEILPQFAQAINEEYQNEDPSNFSSFNLVNRSLQDLKDLESRILDEIERKPELNHSKDGRARQFHPLGKEARDSALLNAEILQQVSNLRTVREFLNRTGEEIKFPGGIDSALGFTIVLRPDGPHETTYNKKLTQDRIKWMFRQRKEGDHPINVGGRTLAKAAVISDLKPREIFRRLVSEVNRVSRRESTART